MIVPVARAVEEDVEAHQKRIEVEKAFAFELNVQIEKWKSEREAVLSKVASVAESHRRYKLQADIWREKQTDLENQILALENQLGKIARKRWVCGSHARTGADYERELLLETQKQMGKQNRELSEQLRSVKKRNTELEEEVEKGTQSMQAGKADTNATNLSEPE